MFKYLVDQVEISLNVENFDEYSILEYSGDEENVKRVKDWLRYQYGCRGHLVGDLATAADLQCVFARDTKFNGKLMAGEQGDYEELPVGLLS